MNSMLAGCGSLIGYREHDSENMDLNLGPGTTLLWLGSV